MCKYFVTGQVESGPVRPGVVGKDLLRAHVRVGELPLFHVLQVVGEGPVGAAVDAPGAEPQAGHLVHLVAVLLAVEVGQAGAVVHGDDGRQRPEVRAGEAVLLAVVGLVVVNRALSGITKK